MSIPRAAAPAAVAPQASSLSYGISSDYLTYATTPEGQQFASAVLGQAGHVRIFAPYDALAYWDGHACAASPSAQAGATAWDKLKRLLLEAKAAGVAPEVVFAEGTGAGGVPVTPDPADPVQANDYTCGVRALMQAFFTNAGSSLQMPVQFEAWNEPENDGYAYRWNLSCRAPAEAVPSCSGPWRAAMLWYIAQTQASSLYAAENGAGFPDLTIAAPTMSAPQKLFFLDAGHFALSSRDGKPYNGYYQSLYRIVHCVPGFGGCQHGSDAPKTMPTVWSVHDYDDPTAMGTADLRAFETALARLNDAYAGGAGAQVWITESGVQLDSLATNDLNLPDGTSCPGNDTRGYDARTFGCLQDNRPENQAAGATAWRSLGTLTHPTDRGEIAVSALYWYDFQLSTVSCTPQSPCNLGRGIVYDSGQVLPELHSWDSALVDSNGKPRPSFCVVTGAPVSRCDGSPHDYEASRWYSWWQPAGIPTPCPAHFGAWVADKADSGLPNGEECRYDASTPLSAAGTSS